MKVRFTLLFFACAAFSHAGELTPRLGFYQWLGAARPANNLLREARDRAADLDAGVFRFYLGGRYDYSRSFMDPARHDGATTLQQIAAQEPVRTALADTRFSTIILTAYPVADYGGGPDDLDLIRPWGPAQARLEAGQIGALCRLLFDEYGDQQRTFVIANHEADEKLMDILNYTGDSARAVANLTAWTNLRHETITTCRNAYPQARLSVLHAFEISAVNLHIAKVGDRYIKTTRGSGWNALRNIVPHVRFDLISYSAYESTNSPFETFDTNQPPERTAVRLNRDLDRIQNAASRSVSATGRRIFGRNSVMIGELGFARERFEPLPTGGVLPRLYHALRAALDWGCPWVVLWQVFDAPRLGAETVGFGAYDQSGAAAALEALPNGCAGVAACFELTVDEGLAAWEAANGY